MDSNVGMAKQKPRNERKRLARQRQEHDENERERRLQSILAQNISPRTPPESIDGQVLAAGCVCRRCSPPWPESFYGGQALAAGWGRHRGWSPPEEIDGQALPAGWAQSTDGNMAFQGTDALDSAPMYTARDANYDAQAQDIGEMIPPRVDTMQKCAVCQQELQGGEQMVRLACGHALHQACCDSWEKARLAIGREPSCAVCRGQLTATDRYLHESDSFEALD